MDKNCRGVITFLFHLSARVCDVSCDIPDYSKLPVQYHCLFIEGFSVSARWVINVLSARYGVYSNLVKCVVNAVNISHGLFLKIFYDQCHMSVGSVNVPRSILR